MIKHIWSVVCQDSKLDADTNSLSLMDTVEEFTFSLTDPKAEYDNKKLNALPAKMEVVSLLYRDTKGKTESIKYRAVFFDPAKNRIGQFENTVDFQAAHDRMRNRVKLDSFAVNTSGVYWCKVYLLEDIKKPKLVSELPITVKIIVNNEEQ